jgi:hypothetical protein
MSDRFSEHRINIKFCVKLEKNACDTCALLSEVYGGEVIKIIKCFWVAQTVCMSKSQMKTMFITFFDIKSTAQFEFIPQG